jgi:hypothetical protein
MLFDKFQHIKKWGDPMVKNVELGECLVFPKIDGTNASVWLGNDITLRAGSRTRELSLDKDNAGFYAWARRQSHLLDFLIANSDMRLFGEWLVPHSLKSYRDDAWRNFYVFDVKVGDTYLPYEEYAPLLEAAGIEYIMPIATIKNGSYEQFVHQLQHNTYLIQDGQGSGEGIVIKNYKFRNRNMDQQWAKIVTSEFKEKHFRAMGANEVDGAKMVEETITKDYCTQALCEKVKAKIELDRGEWTKRCIPQLMSTVLYDIINEDMWAILKEHKNPTINFATLRYLVQAQIREHLPEVFR